MRLAWTTDIHLNHVQMPAWDQWLAQVAAARPDAVLITGDISESDDVIFQLRRIAESIPTPIYFVLGNHDFYFSSIAATRQRVSALARDVDSLCYLSDCGPIELSPTHFLVGEDGWGDATEGDYENSMVRLNDFATIKDFTRVDPIDWPAMLRGQGAESAQRLQDKLAVVPAQAREILVATHVPPFREACWYEGKTTDDHWAPFFVCGQVGKVLRDYARQNPGVQLTVICGHTHHGGTAEMLPNLVVHTAAADYGIPKLDRVLEI
ncbi:metallophosphoesterase [Stieleria sp. TO1_6]|uniref:metallophosphoesterase family protein n=1 Tax=Stieleria tagensis TaxID=2956795 RepID=UPI00209AA69E|nr:metallophosphoesterase [Stieleria tagensis]MCO8125501.1 metallophosphoesterase [Stieleria tagensis]